MILVRGNESDEGTTGWLIAHGEVFRSLELPWRDNQTNISRIPPGTYPMQFIKTGRPHSGFFYSYWVKDVPGRSGILFHAGNYAGDRAKGLLSHSWGCVLLGERVGVLNGQRAVLASRQAITRFHGAMQKRNDELVILE